jgi:exodeoxyribonuclease I
MSRIPDRSTPASGYAPRPDPEFFWHDYETFGRDPRRDRPVQFAGLRTNAALEEIGEPVSLFCQPPADCLPEPESVLVTGITPQRARAEGVPEHRFAAAIEAELSRPGTIGVGYNSIRFDDEVTRHLFWRNLIDPYAREWREGCSRWDLMDVLRCCWSLRPDGIEWPRYTEGELAGRPSFRLEHLSAANGLAHESAHEALSDVRATLGMARLVRERKRSLWDFCLTLRHKDAVRAQIGSGRPFVHLSGRYPAERGFLAVVVPLAPHPSNGNELIVWDLAEDPRALAELDVETVRRRLFTRREELPAGEARLPIKTLHLNRSPIVIGNLRVLGDAAERWGLDVPQAQAHAEHADAVSRHCAGLWRDVFQRPPPSTPPDVDEDLYGGFVGDEDRRTLQRLRGLQPESLAAARPAFRDGRLEELLFRYRARNFPETLDADERARWQAHCRARWHEGSGGRPTLAAWMERLDTLAEDAMAREDDRAQALLEALLDDAQERAPDV